MNCAEIQNRLSEYFDKSLDAISAKAVELHLASCLLCRAEAVALNDCIRQVAALPAVEPPPGFAQRVMAHVREIEARPTLWQRLFFPLKIKIPIHASAVVVVAGLAISLSQKQAPIDPQDSRTGSAAPISAEQNAPAPPVSALPQPALPDSSPAASAQKPTRLAQPFVAQANTPGPSAPSAAGTPPSTAALKSSIAERVEPRQETPRRPPIQAQEVATGREALRFDQLIMGMGAGQSRPSLRASPFSAERSLSPFGELSADVEFVVRRRGAQTLVSDLAAKRSPSATLTPQIAEIRWFSVQSDLYERFKNELAAEASIESEKAAFESDFDQKPSRDLLIKVIILSPLER